MQPGNGRCRTQTVLHASGYAPLLGLAARRQRRRHAARSAQRSIARTDWRAARGHPSAGRHLLKAGLEWQRLTLREAFAFAVTDEDAAEDAGLREEVLEFTPDNPLRVRGRGRPGHPVGVRAGLVAGGRSCDAQRRGPLRSQPAAARSIAVEPAPRRGGAPLVLDARARGAISRFFQPPQPENLLLSSSPEARVLSSSEVGDAVGGADVEPERQWGGEVGVDHALTPRLRVDASYWRRRIENAADPNVFAGTTIIFPNAVAKGRAHGLDVRLEATRADGWAGYASWSLARVDSDRTDHRRTVSRRRSGRARPRRRIRAGPRSARRGQRWCDLAGGVRARFRGDGALRVGHADPT